MGWKSARDVIEHWLGCKGSEQQVNDTFWERNSKGLNCYEIAVATNNEPVANLILDQNDMFARQYNPDTKKLPLSMAVVGDKHPLMVKQLIDAFPRALLDKDYYNKPLLALLCKEYKGSSHDDYVDVTTHATNKIRGLGWD